MVKQKRGHGCLYTFLAVAGLLVVILIIAAVSAGNEKKEKEAANEATCSGLSYPDHQATDQCADAQGQVKLHGFTITATNVRRVASTNEFIGPEICADVSYFNRADGSSNYSQFDWKLQTPAGVVQSFEFTANATLDTGQIVSGGSKSGTVCFRDNAEAGQFVLIWKDGFLPDRGVWIVNL